MSHHLRVQGFKPADEKWKKMKAVWDACKAAKIDPPEDVAAFFHWESPDPHGVELDQLALENLGVLHEYHAEMCNGYDIELAKLPADVKVLRVYISY